MKSSATARSTNFVSLRKLPAFRKLKAYGFDPSLSLKMDTAAINNIVYKIRWEPLRVGPAGEYLEVIDYDPTVDKYYKPVSLEDPYLLAQDGLDPSESNPQFHQQMVYAVAMNTIQNFEAALGRKVQWASRRVLGVEYEQFVRRLRIYPHALKDANAFYSPLKKAILFGYFSSAPADETLLMPESLVFTCLSHDIIAHEVTHAILDGMHYYYNEATNPDVLAFHEAFADIVALFQHFTFPEVLRHQIAKTRGDLSSQNLLGELAQQFGSAIGSYGSLRDALGETNEKGVWKPKEPNAEDYRTEMEPHERGSILVAAVFEAFISIYKSRIADLLRIASGGTGILPQGELHPDLVNRLTAEASKAAGHILAMCIRALDYTPPVDITFGDYLRAIITADIDLVKDDKHGYRLAIIDAFRKRGIYPEGIKTLSIESLQHKELNIGSVSGKQLLQQSDEMGRETDVHFDHETAELLGVINQFLRDYADAIKYVSDREEIHKLTRLYIRGGPDAQQGLHSRIKTKFSRSLGFAKITGLAFVENPAELGIRQSGKYSGPSFQIQNLRLVNRVGPDGSHINHVIFSLVQRSGVALHEGKFLRHFEPKPEDDQPALDEPMPAEHFNFRGGCTLIFDLDTLKLKYAVSKPLLDLALLTDTGGARLSIDLQRVYRQYRYQFQDSLVHKNDYALYFGGNLHQVSEPFAFLHQH